MSNEGFIEGTHYMVSESGCWIWTRSTIAAGYGQVRRCGTTKRVHRVSYEQHVGPIPAGMCVLHRCDVRACLNPDHLFLGTRADNSADMVAKGRHARGSARPSAKLAEADIPRIRRAYAGGERQKSIASRYGVDPSTISLITSGVTWSHIPTEGALS